MNVFHISAAKTWGGGEHHLENLIYELRNTPEVSNRVLCVKDSLLQQRLGKLNIPVYTAPLAFKADFRFMIRIGRLCREEHIDLIHLHDPTALTLYVMADRLFRLPPFVYSKKTSFPIKQRRQTLYKYNHPKLRKILCVSQLTKEIASEAIEDSEKLKVIYHGTRMDNKSTETPFELREKFDIPEQVHVIGHIGNHIKAKDLQTWINTIDFLINKQQRRDLRFVQIGSFAEEFTPGIQTELEQLELSDYVHLLDYQPNASNFIAQFDVLLLTSYSEGLPQVILEAFYHRVPVVSTEVGGIPEVITQGENGFLAPIGDFKALGSHIIELLDNEALAEQFRQKSYGKLFPTLTTENMAKETMEVYRSVNLKMDYE